MSFGIKYLRNWAWFVILVVTFHLNSFQKDVRFFQFIFVIHANARAWHYWYKALNFSIFSLTPLIFLLIKNDACKILDLSGNCNVISNALNLYILYDKWSENYKKGYKKEDVFKFLFDWVNDRIVILQVKCNN